MKPLEGQFFRVAGPRHTSAAAITNGVGAFLSGGRWNPPSLMKAVYMSRSPVTAMHESVATYSYHSIPITDFPKVTIAIEACLEAILDFSDSFVSTFLPEPISTLLAEDWRSLNHLGQEGTAQAIGRIAYEFGCQGLIIPSKPDPTGINLVVFPEKFGKKSKLTVQNAEALDKLGKAE